MCNNAEQWVSGFQFGFQSFEFLVSGCGDWSGEKMRHVGRWARRFGEVGGVRGVAEVGETGDR